MADRKSDKKLSDLIVGTPGSPTAKAFEELDALDARRQELEAQGSVGSPQAPREGGWLGHGDPIERGMNWASENLVPAGTPSWLRTLGRYTIPQNSVEAALMAATLPLGGAGGIVAKTLGKGAGGVASKVFGKAVSEGAPGTAAFLGRVAKGALKGAAVGGVAGGATGHDLTESAALGGAGGGLGQAAGEGASAVLQTATVKKMTKAASEKLKGAFDSLFPQVQHAAVPTRPAVTTAGDALKRVIAGDEAAQIEQSIRSLGQRYQVNPSAWERDFLAQGVNGQDMAKWLPIVNAHAAAEGKAATKTIRFPGTVPGQPGVVGQMPQVQAYWQYGTPEIRRWLIDKGYILQGAGDAAAYRDLAKQAAGADVIRRWVTGAPDPRALTQEQLDEVTKRLLGAGGELSTEGVNELSRRWATMQRELQRTLGVPEARNLADAVFHDVGQGVQRGTSGAAPTARVIARPTRGHISVEGGGARIPHLPGWEQEANAAGKAAVAATKPVLTQAPPHLVDREPPPAPLEEKAPPPTPSPVPPAPDAVEDRAAAPPIAPPPERPAPPTWWKPETQNDGDQAWFRQPLAPGPSLTGEPPKPGLSLDLKKEE